MNAQFFLHVAIQVYEASFMHTKTETLEFYVKTTIILHWRCLGTPDCIWIENTFVNLIIFIRKISKVNAIHLYQFKRYMPLWKDRDAHITCSKQVENCVSILYGFYITEAHIDGNVMLHIDKALHTGMSVLVNVVGMEWSPPTWSPLLQPYQFHTPEFHTRSR